MQRVLESKEQLFSLRRGRGQRRGVQPLFQDRGPRPRDIPSLIEALESDDGEEGVQAFREKRAPVWKGR